MYPMKLFAKDPAFFRLLGRPPAPGPGALCPLAVVDPHWQGPLPPLTCRVLLLPGTLAPWAGAVQARWAVTYGLSPRDTLTLSSLARRGACLTLQREIVTLSGRCLDPQDLPLPSTCLPPLSLLAWAGVHLLTDTPFPQQIETGEA